MFNRFKSLCRSRVRVVNRAAPFVVRAAVALPWPSARLRVFVAQSAELAEAVVGTEFRIRRGPLTGFRLTGLLVDEMTIDDPDAFVASWKETTRTYAYRGDFKLQEFWCSENNRGVDGSTGLPKFQ